MKRRCLLWLGIVLTLLIAAVPLDPTFVLRGWLRGESFYQGRPTCYWSRQIRREASRRYLRWSAAGSLPSKKAELQAWFFQKWEGLFARGSPNEMLPLFEKDPAAVPVLRELLNDGDSRVRSEAAIALLMLKAAKPKELLPQLGDVLVRGRSPNREVRWDDYPERCWAAGLLEEFGSEAEPAIPALLVTMTDQGAFNGSNKDSVSAKARRTLLAIGPPAVPPLIETLKNGDKDTRIAAARVLGDMGADAGRQYRHCARLMGMGKSV